MQAAEQAQMARVLNLLTSSFNESELRDLCFRLAVNYEDLGGAARADRARELVLHCNRHGRIAELEQLCCQLRPRACAELAGQMVALPDPPPYRRMPWRAVGAIAGLLAVLLLGLALRAWQLPGPGPAPTPGPSATGAAPATSTSAFAGIWQVSEQSTAGSSLENWNIQLDGGQLAIEAFDAQVEGFPLPSDHHEQLRLSDVQIGAQTLAFTVKRFGSVTIDYSLHLVDSDRIEGTYSSIDTFLSDNGAIQGTAGVIEDSGRVIMVRKQP